MKQLLMRSIFFLAALFFGIVLLPAQQFNWVTGGGTNENLSTAPSSTDWEMVKFMCTDADGNIYALSQVGYTTIYADTFTGAAYGADQNILVTSYNCSGQMRWAKLIACPGQTTPQALTSDRLGHIYVAGDFTAGGDVHVGSDTVTPASYFREGIVQLDTNGHCNWIRFAGNNSMASFTGVGGTATTIAIDSDNNAHLISFMISNVVLLPGDTSHYGCYDIKITPSGTTLSAIRLPLDSTLSVVRATIDKQSNKLYVYGYRGYNFWIGGGEPGADSSAYNYIAEFDTARNLVWKDTFATGGSASEEGIVSSIVADGNGHLYLSGAGYGYIVYGSTTIYPPPGGPSFGVAYIMKMDTAGNLRWMKQCNSQYGVGYGAITLDRNNRVASVGDFVGLAISGTDSIYSPTNTPFLTVLDTAGNLIAQQRIEGDAFYNGGMAITSDSIGNLYIGGYVGDTIPDTLIPAYHTVGGNTDFFVLKYGVDCSCTSMPVANYSYTGTSTVNVTYTGTTTGLDSVVWNFGDGTKGHGLTASHTYTVVGTVDLCVTVYTTCGYDIKCDSMQVNCPATITSSFSHSGTPPVSNFTYTGTTIGLDSVKWTFGDSGTGTGISPSHTYSAVGTYTVCATTYTACGYATGCSTVNISCVATPTATFTDTGTVTRGFTYTGTTVGIDSMVWNYGDGDTSHVLNPVHTYTANGTYHVCVTVYTSCGSDSSCGSVVIHGLGISNVQLANVKVFPNPAMNELIVTGINGNTNYRLFNVTGVSLQQGVLRAGINTIPIQDYAPGIYILEMTGQDGVKDMVRVVKE